MYSYNGLRASQITTFFPFALPCACYDDASKIYKIPRYDVRIKYGTTEYGYRGRILKEITVECDCCGRSKRTDVEYRDVYQKDLNW